MKKPHPLLFSLQQLSTDLALINRNHYLAGTDRHENDVEHSLTVALLCWFIHDKYQINLDIGKILKYALAHDFVEVHAGDTNTFADSQARQTKAKLEEVALAKMSTDFQEFGDMVATMQRYEEKADDEALFVWTVDKMQAMIMGDLDNWRPYQEYGIDYERFCQKYESLLAKCSPYCREIFVGLFEYCKTTYPRPN